MYNCTPGTLNNHFFWLFQLDDAKSLHEKWLFHLKKNGGWI